MALTLKYPSPRRRRSAEGNMSEFSIALYVFLLIIAFPLIDLLAVASGAAVMLLGANQVATTVSAQRRFPDCLASMQSETNSYLSGNFAKFMKLQPVGGYLNSGSDLYIDSSSFVGSSTNRIGPNAPVPPPIDTSANIYECTVQMKCQVGPLVNLSFVPFLGNVPGLSVPALLTLSSSKAVEYPRGLEFPSSNIASAGSLPALYQSPTAAVPPGSDGSGWNNPSIYDQIKAAGETIIAQEVVEVQANNNNYAPTTITVSPGQKIWIDTRADGVWSTSAGADPNINANGYNYSPPFYMCPSAPAGSLIGKLAGTGSPFFLGVDKFNYPPAGTGTLGLMINDGSDPTCYSDNSGVQIVRVILVQ